MLLQLIWWEFGSSCKHRPSGKVGCLGWCLLWLASGEVRDRSQLVQGFDPPGQAELPWAHGKSILQLCGLKAVRPLPLDICRQREPDGAYPLPSALPSLGRPWQRGSQGLNRRPTRLPKSRQAWHLGSSTGPLLAPGVPPSPGCLLDFPRIPSLAGPVAEQQDVAWSERSLSS